MPKNIFKGKNWNKILKIWLVKILIQHCDVARSKIFCDVGFDSTILYYLVIINENMLYKDIQIPVEEVPYFKLQLLNYDTDFFNSMS